MKTDSKRWRTRRVAAISVGLALWSSEPAVLAAQDAGATAGSFLPKQGLTLSLWAREPQVADPVALNFDDQGRLYVAETARRGTVDIDIRSHPGWLVEDLANQSVEDLRAFFHSRMSPERSAENARWLPDYNKDGSHDWKDLKGVKERIRLLEDPMRTGRATRSRVFFEGFNEEVTGVLAGVLPWRGDVFATVYPDLWRLRDTKGVGGPTSAKSMFRGFGVHAAFDGHDLHGLVIGPDGKLYFSQGDNGFVVRTREGRVLKKPNTGGVFRMNPDGSELELFAWGLRNVQEIAFDEFGNMFGVDNDGDLADERERFVYITEGSDSGWRLHWQFKERGWQKQTRLPNYNPWIDERMWVPLHAGQPAHITPPLSNYSVGPSGFKYNPGTGLNDAYRNSFFLVQFPVKKITAFQTRPKGAGFEMVGEHVLLTGMMASATAFGPDGALYIADWDGMWNPDGKGAIWVLDDPKAARSAIRGEVQRLLAEGVEGRPSADLALLLSHVDMRIRMRAQFELAHRREAKLFLRMATNAAAPRMARVHSMWGVGQLKDGRQASMLPFADPDPEIRAQAAKLAGELHATRTAPMLTRLLEDPDPRAQFHAALALGKIGDESVIPAIARLLERNGDRDAFIRHACVYALAGAGTPASLRRLSTHPSPSVRIAAIVALRRLGAPEAASFLSDANPFVRQEAARAIHDDEGIPEALPRLIDLLAPGRATEPEAIARRAISACVRVGGKPEAERLLQFALDAGHPESHRAEALEALASWDRSPALDRVEGMVRRLTPKPSQEAQWGRALIQANIAKLFEKSGPLMSEAIARAIGDNAIAVDPLVLRALIASESQRPATRAQALRVFAKTAPDSALPLAREQLDSFVPALRLAGLELLAELDPSAFTSTITQRFDHFPLPLQQKALELAGGMTRGGLDGLIREKSDELANGKLARELELDVLQAAARRHLKPQGRAGEPTQPTAWKKSGSQLKEALYGGDPARGEDLFRNHVAAQCVRCHEAGGKGKQAGPILKGIGSRATREYILESMVNPSAQIAPGFETLTLTLRDGGERIGGQKLSEDDAQITLDLPEGETRSIPKAQIGSMTTDKVSSMPPMLDILSPFEIRDLVAFLMEQK
ncbi:MAG: HEAT repeat domain-containing protein [Verrucomicrobia bacterium]|nr:HEAT repeat domain-containing protein [Verrucomicrobiota bacterium]MBI3870551.1 HEAT repeat domain-containing protein [Verrucomicrobiota bacterium]